VLPNIITKLAQQFRRYHPGIPQYIPAIGWLYLGKGGKGKDQREKDEDRSHHTKLIHYAYPGASPKIPVLGYTVFVVFFSSSFGKFNRHEAYTFNALSPDHG
jgi:hypothetical protein